MIRPGDEPIAGYRVEKRLGSGQYGEVWQATSPGGTSVALKFLDMTGRAGWKEFRAIQRVKSIRHAHLMPMVALWLLDDEGKVLSDDAVQNFAGETPDAARTLSAETLADHRPPAQMVIATLLGDCSLRDRLEESLGRGEPGIPTDELLGYLEEAAKGIDHLNQGRHPSPTGQVGVQHCDIKPDNILLTGGSAVVCDFGVAQLLAEGEQDSRATSLSGSPAYMSPESFRAQPSASSDQYALAVTYYELRTGRLPIDEGNFAAAYEAHQQGKLDFSAVGSSEQAVLKKATSPDPSDRYPSASEMVDALREAVRPATGQDPKAASPTIWYIAAGVALLLAVVAGFRLADNPRDTSAPDTPPPTATTLAFDVAAIPVVVNGKTHRVGANGELKLSVRPHTPLVIEFAGDGQRRAMQWTVPAEQIAAQSRHELPLPPTAAALAREAEQLLAEGESARAAKTYAGAVEQDPEVYARLPEPEVIDAGSLLWPSCFGITPQGDAIVTGHKDGVVRLWSLTGEGVVPESVELYRHGDVPVVDLAVAKSYVFSADEQGAVGWARRPGLGAPAAGSAPGESIERSELIPGDTLPRAIAATGDENWLIVATTENFQTSVAAWPIAEIGKASEPAHLGTQPGEFPRLRSVGGPAVVVATIDREALLYRWSAEPAGSEPLGTQQNEILTLAVSGDLKRVAYGGVRGELGEEAAAVVDLTTGRRFPLAGAQADSILATALDRSGELLATAERIGELDPSGQVVLWRTNDRAESTVADRTLEYDKPLGDATALALSLSAEWISAGHDRGAVSLWQLDDGASATRTPVLSSGEGQRIEAMAITGDGRWLIAVSHDGRLLSLDLARLEMVLEACRQVDVKPHATKDRAT